MTTFRIRWAMLAVAALGVGASELSCRREALPPPNIIVVVADSLRSDYLGIYGFAGEISPHIDRFAGEGVVFTNCLSQAPWTKPSVASLFTSTHPTVHGMRGPIDFWTRSDEVEVIEVLSQELVTLAEGMKQAGYVTSARSDNPWLRTVNGYSRGFDYFSPSTADGIGSADDLQAHIADLRKGAPFFLYLHYMEVHAPYPYVESDFQMLRSSAGLGPPHEITEAEAGTRPGYLNELIDHGIDRLDLRDWKAAYATGVALLDRRFGALFDWLGKAGALEDTLVVLTSDHGEEFLEHGHWEHGRTLCNHQLNVPLIVRWPKALHAGKSDDRLVGLIDLMPSLLGVARNRRVLPQVAGIDLFGQQDDASGAERVVFASALKGHPTFVAAQTRSSKLIWDYPSGGARFFDLLLNPEEQRTGAPLRGRPEERGRLKELIRSVGEQESMRTVRAFEGGIDERAIGQLRELGYAE